MNNLSDLGIHILHYSFTFKEWFHYSFLSFTITFIIETIIMKYYLKQCWKEALIFSLLMNGVTYALGILMMQIWVTTLPSYHSYW